MIEKLRNDMEVSLNSVGGEAASVRHLSVHHFCSELVWIEQKHLNFEAEPFRAMNWL